MCWLFLNKYWCTQTQSGSCEGQVLRLSDSKYGHVGNCQKSDVFCVLNTGSRLPVAGLVSVPWPYRQYGNQGCRCHTVLPQVCAGFSLRLVKSRTHVVETDQSFFHFSVLWLVALSEIIFCPLLLTVKSWKEMHQITSMPPANLPLKRFAIKLSI